MIPHFLRRCVLLALLTPTLTSAQSSGEDVYTGYSLSSINDESHDVIYATSSTPANVSTTNPPPDVVLNATVNVGQIDLLVANLSAKINLDVQVLQLLQFNAGVVASIDRVTLSISNVSAQVQLEARLANLVTMINDVLDSVDLNPALATLGQVVNSTLNSTASTLSSNSNTVAARSLNLVDNILYSINDYSGHTHTNRILAQNGSLVDQSLDNDGNLYSEQVVGYYATAMTFNGYDQTVLTNGQAERELQYAYQPYAGLEVISAIFVDAADKVVATQVLSESSGGGSSTVVGP
jgi:hypothetical protein